jgi:hypothetical protein
MTLAIGGSTAPTKTSNGAYWVDVRDYGAKADNGVTDNSVPFQAAIDDLALKLNGAKDGKGIVYIPSAPLPYRLNKSVWVDCNNVEIRGDGWGTNVSMSLPYKHSMFIFGIRRVEQTLINGVWVPVRLDATNRPDLFGKLDLSAVPNPGTRWGIRTNGNSFVQFHAGPISAGVSSAVSNAYPDLWSETSKLTVEFCVEPPDGQPFPVNSPLLGVGTPLTDTAPFAFSIWGDPQSVVAMFRTSDMKAGVDATSRYFSISLAGATPPYRIAVQFDLDNAVCTAFVNGVQSNLTNMQNMTPDATSNPPFLPSKGVKFATNDHHPFMIGASGFQGQYGAPTGTDLRLYGLRLSNTLRYQNKGPGHVQTRVDAPTAPINDSYSYFGNDNNTICFLSGQDNPATAGRVVTVQNGNVVTWSGFSSGIFLHSVAPSGVSFNAIRDILLVSSPPYGQTICLGTVLEMTIENVKASSGFSAVGTFIATANYNVYIRNCWLEAFESPYFGAMQISSGRDIVFGTAGRVTMRHLGCSAKWENIFVAFPSPVTESVFRARGCCYGGNYSITNMTVDFEGSSFSHCGIYCESHCLAPATSLVLREIFFGTVGSGVPMVMLRDLFKAFELLHNCWVSADNVQSFGGDYLAAFDVDGPLWHGEVKSLALGGTPLVHQQRWGTNTNIAIHAYTFVAPPRTASWYNGAHILEVRSPANGQYAEWRCAGSGTYGSPTPPTWVGVNPISVSQNGLAAYLLNHAYTTAALS